MKQEEFSVQPIESMKGVQPVSQFVPVERYQRSPPTRLHVGHKAASAFLPYFEKPSAAMPAQKLFSTPNVLVQGKGTMVVGQSVAKENMEGAPTAKILADLNSQPPVAVRTIREPILYTSRYGVKNYGHCLTDILPRVINVWRSHPDLKIALHPEFVGNVLDAMHGLGLPPDRIVTLDEAPTLLVHGHFAGPCSIHPVVHSPSALALLRTDLPRLLRESRPKTSAERLFVTRADAKSRHLENHAEVAAALQREGYQEFSVGALSHAEQAATFEQAREIVAVAGASMTNIVYCRPGTRVTLLSPSTMSALYFWDLANLLSLDFRIGYFAPRNPQRGIHADFSAEPAEIMRLCRD